ncbi:hypothetical protein V865_001302 [Kwoniella europaea PYCC6329]|uniref:Uncharacterized protein n=1 Tax=Kwoniella europaea PYCC6329 TaxID=1423913 RepID=A0AAX4K9N3_9TREE
MPKPTLLILRTPNEAKSFFWLSENTIAYFYGSTIKYFTLPSSDKLGQFNNASNAHEDLQTFPKVWEAEVNFEKVDEDQCKSQEEGSEIRYNELFVRYKDKWRMPGKVYTVGHVRLVREGEDWLAGEINGEKDHGINPNTDQFQGGKYNPINNVNKWKTPTLIIHGAKHFRVPLSQAIVEFSMLKKPF